jgi:transketolase
MAETRGISYLRTTREKTPVIYGPDDEFPVGGSKTVLSRPDDAVTIVGAGVTVHQALIAAERLAAEGIGARVIDAYSVKPIDHDALGLAARETRGVVIVEDHWPQGGLGEAVLAALAESDERPPVRHLAVRFMPGSGTPEELRHEAGIDAAAIVSAARELARL